MTHLPFNPLESPTGKPSLTVNLQEGSNEQVSIVVVHHERPEFLNICLQSIYAMSNLNNYEVIVVDNGSGQETQEYLDVLEQQGIKVVRNQHNEYWSKAANQGAAAADPHSKYFIFMHADTVVLDPSWIDVLVNLSVSRKCGMVGTSRQAYHIQKQSITFLHESCVLFSRKCWEDVGPWPEELPLVGMAFILTLKALYKGHQPTTIGNDIVHHYKSFSMDPSEYERICENAMATVGKMMAKIQAAG